MALKVQVGQSKFENVIFISQKKLITLKCFDGFKWSVLIELIESLSQNIFHKTNAL